MASTGFSPLWRRVNPSLPASKRLQPVEIR